VRQRSGVKPLPVPIHLVVTKPQRKYIYLLRRQLAFGLAVDGLQLDRRRAALPFRHGSFFDFHIGSSSFILTTITDDGTSWYPKIYDNLIILAENGTMFIDNSPKMNKTYSCYFRPETVFKNNVYMSSNWFDGTAKEFEGYEFTLSPVDCAELDSAPRFMSTEIGNENEYRMRATKLDWAFTTAVGGYPNYVGAVEPFLAPISTLIILQ
jgi:hypothetical protein